MEYRYYCIVHVSSSETCIIYCWNYIIWWILLCMSHNFFMFLTSVFTEITVRLLCGNCITTVLLFLYNCELHNFYDEDFSSFLFCAFLIDSTDQWLFDARLLTFHIQGLQFSKGSVRTFTSLFPYLPVSM